MENNRKNSSDLIERYLYDVTRRLPQSQRDDIEKELRSLIEDMLMDKTEGKEPTEQDIEAVLLKLGKPSKLADKYRGSKRYLIGPDYFDTYILVLKIVLLATGFGITVAMIVGYFATPPENVLKSFEEYIDSVMSALFQAFGFVTIGFALAQKYGTNIESHREKTWKPSELPEIPVQKAKIKRSEPIVSIVFTVLIIILFNSAPNLIGACFLDKTHTLIPLFDLTVLKSMMPLINVMFCINIVKDFLKLLFGKYTINLAIFVTIINVAAVALAVFVFASPDIWNPNFLTSLLANGSIKFPQDLNFAYVWSQVPKILTGIIVAGYLLDTIVTIIRSLKYSVKNNLKFVKNP